MTEFGRFLFDLAAGAHKGRTYTLDDGDPHYAVENTAQLYVMERKDTETVITPMRSTDER